MNSRSPRRMKSEQTNLLSSPQDRPQDEERGLYAVSSPSPRDEGVAVQKGQSRIAQRFNAGLDAKKSRVPQGRLRPNPTRHPSAVPDTGLVSQAGCFPASKRRAILAMSLRDKGTRPSAFPQWKEPNSSREP